ncbi:unnamed protein product, partial [Rotaria magnacalcarata]
MGQQFPNALQSQRAAVLLLQQQQQQQQPQQQQQQQKALFQNYGQESNTYQTTITADDPYIR